MTEKNKGFTIYDFISILLKIALLFVVLFITIGMIIATINISSRFDQGRDTRNYCNNIYPPKIQENYFTHWAELRDVEEGYVRCCRYIYVEHERREECQIFPYKK